MSKPIKAGPECGECKYLIDYHNHPDTTGYSMAKQGWSWWGCMRLLATINHPEREHVCHRYENRERQLELL